MSSNTSGMSDRRAWRGAERRLPPPLAGHALLQSAALSAAARDHPHAGHRPAVVVARCRGSPIIASARASSSRRTRRTSSPTTSACSAWRRRCRALEAGDLHHRGDRRDHRPGASAGRRARRSARWTSPASTFSRTWRRTWPIVSTIRRRGRDSRCPPIVSALVERGWIGDKAGQGFYKRVPPAKGDAAGKAEILTLDPATLDVPPEAVRPPGRARGGAQRSRTPASASGRCSSARTRSARSFGPRSGRRCSTRRASRPTSRPRSTTSIARCGGDSAGSWDRSRSGTPSAFRRVLEATGDGGVGRCPRSSRRCSPRDDRGSAKAQLPPASRRPADSQRRQGSAAGRSQERRRQPRRSRRRRACRGVPFEDEQHRRRHDPDAAGRRQGSRGELSRRSSSATTRRTSPPAPT